MTVDLSSKFQVIEEQFLDWEKTKEKDRTFGTVINGFATKIIFRRGGFFYQANEKVFVEHSVNIATADPKFKELFDKYFPVKSFHNTEVFAAQTNLLKNFTLHIYKDHATLEKDLYRRFKVYQEEGASSCILM